MDDDGFLFLRLSRDGQGTVHVFRDRYVRPLPGIPGEEQGDDISPVAELFRVRLRSRCGKSELEAVIFHTCWTGSFADDDLCAACYKTVPEDQRSELFEHEVPDSTAG